MYAQRNNYGQTALKLPSDLKGSLSFTYSTKRNDYGEKYSTGNKMHLNVLCDFRFNVSTNIDEVTTGLLLRNAQTPFTVPDLMGHAPCGIFKIAYRITLGIPHNRFANSFC
jgi:hypothetical protein